MTPCVPGSEAERAIHALDAAKDYGADNWLVTGYGRELIRSELALLAELERERDEARKAALVLDDDTVCACLHETGERKVRLYERCMRCGAFMDASYRSEELAEAERVLRELAEPVKVHMPENDPEGTGYIEDVLQRQRLARAYFDTREQA